MAEPDAGLVANKIPCRTVGQLRWAMEPLTDDCELSSPVNATYHIENGEGFLSVRPADHAQQSAELKRLRAGCRETQFQLAEEEKDNSRMRAELAQLVRFKQAVTALSNHDRDELAALCGKISVGLCICGYHQQFVFAQPKGSQ